MWWWSLVTYCIAYYLIVYSSCLAIVLITCITYPRRMVLDVILSIDHFSGEYRNNNKAWVYDLCTRYRLVDL